MRFISDIIRAIKSNPGTRSVDTICKLCQCTREDFEYTVDMYSESFGHVLNSATNEEVAEQAREGLDSFKLQVELVRSVK